MIERRGEGPGSAEVRRQTEGHGGGGGSDRAGSGRCGGVMAAGDGVRGDGGAPGRRSCHGDLQTGRSWASDRTPDSRQRRPAGRDAAQATMTGMFINCATEQLAMQPIIQTVPGM